ncbi:MAG: cell division protein FtsL [Chitinivibrionales bacterium]
MIMRYKARKSRKKENTKPADAQMDSSNGGIFTFRMLLICIAVLALVVSLPLFTVWKQVYITNTALRNQHIADSLRVLNREALRLRLAAQKLSSTRRIEHIAQKQLSLRYPSSREIIIIRPDKENKLVFSMPKWRILAVLRKSLTQEKG